MDTEDILREKLSKTIGVVEKSNIMYFIKENQVPLSLIFELATCKQDPKIAFKAAWIFEEIILCDFTLLDPLLFNFLNNFSKTNNRSVRRHFSKILCKLVFVFFDKSKKEIISPQVQEILGTYNFECIIETLFDWLIDEKEKAGVKVWCIEALFYLSIKYKWIIDELEPQIDFLTKQGSCAITSRGRKVKNLIKVSK